MKIGVFGKSNIVMIDRSFDFIYDPIWYYENGKLRTNFDIVLLDDNFDYNEEFLNTIKFLNIPLIGLYRLSKYAQHLILRKYGINCPDTYYYNGNSFDQDRLMSLLYNFEEDEEIVIKMVTGARGLGTTLVKKKYIQRYTYSKYVDKEHKLLIGKEINEETKNLTREQLEKNHVIFQKKINVVKEFRSFFFYGSPPIFYDRNISDENEFGTASMNKQTTRQCLLQPDPIFDKIQQIVEDKNIPYLSVDLYKDSEGDYGVFEFQMEFGHTYIPNHSYLIDKMTEGLQNLLNTF